MSDDVKKLVAEFLGTAFLVFIACGTAVLTLGMGSGDSKVAGVVATALAFGLVLLAMAYAFGPVSGCHINPAVTMGFVIAKDMSISEAIRYWAAQLAGGIVGALGLWAVLGGSPGYDKSTIGLGSDGYGKHSMVGLNAGSAFLAEVLLTALFVYVVLAVSGRMNPSPAVGGLAAGLALTAVHLIGIPLTGTSVNPARSLGPALIQGGDALEQVWLFILAPLVGGVLAGVLHEFFAPRRQQSSAARRRRR